MGRPYSRDAVLYVGCPDCGALLPVPVWIEPTNTKSDDGVLQVTVLQDNLEVQAHALSCAPS